MSESVDLVSTGLTGATDVSAVIAAIPPPKSGEQPVVIRTRERTPGTSRTKGRGRAVLIAVVILAILGVVAYLVARPSSGPAESHSSPGASSTADGISPQSLTLTGKLLPAPEGADAMRAVAVAPSGQLVGVGTSLRQEPRAWFRRDGQWAVASVSGGQGTIEDVAAASNGLVGVGWSGAGDQRRPAVWTSGDGTKWTLVPAAGDFAPAKGLSELTAITADANGGLLAAAIDRRTDRVDGDVALYSSTDGTQWTTATATGLSGPGPQAVQRMARTSRGLVAIGSALIGAHRGPAIWTFADGKTWKAASDVPPGSPALWAITEQPDKALLVCGSVGTADQPGVQCWRQKDGPWQTYAARNANGSPTPLYVYGLAMTGDGVEAVGVGRSGDKVDAATWVISD